VLSALRLAHAEGIIHCDVRPSNIVVADRGAVLVDWGLACPASAGYNSANRGVPSFCEDRVFDQSTYSARPAQDASALLYTWLALAFDGNCCAPWDCPCPRKMWEKRRLWLKSGSHAAVQRASAALQLILAASSGQDVLDLVQQALEGAA
jgi:serine/threonine protein kinase